ncbi:HK97 family phage portal protein [Pseudoxanthomonas spadix BD-a59]|uniref:HK97 family phage portal protein n=1 Tax=Pseudoxanthomonas spadix (strain BD-a59) TaxID=1045855 RepID=G7UQ43_PSEUP|nr:phage portal protein [Pseudoxanthomonas spadix]AER56927.1 HK97 family phage portal protein [Pseudoxanthomonas spadix BD-a59]
MKWPWAKTEKRDADPSWAALVNHGAVSASGQFVDARSVESVSTAFSAVNLIAGTVASLPLHVYRRLDNGDRERASEHPLASILGARPNSVQTAFELREMMTAQCLLHGNAFAEIRTDAAGTVAELRPIHPRDVTVVRLANGRHRYDVSTDGRVRSLLAEEVLHLRDRSDDGLVGRSRVQASRETLGGALALQAHGNRSFANSARLSGVLQTSGILTAEQVKRLGESWRAQYAGADNVGKTAILEGGLSFSPLSMSNEDAQWLQAQQFSVEEVARLFNVPPVLLGDLRHANFSNSVEMMRHFVTVTLRPWLTRWEQALERSLLGPIARGRYYVEHSAEGLLRGDAVNRADFYAKGISAGWLLPSEARRLENLPTIEGLDNAAD